MRSGGDGHGLLHAFARDSIFGWVSVPGSQENKFPKDFLHVRDLVESILAVMQSPPPTREAIAIGTGHGVNLNDVAQIFARETGAEPVFGTDDSQEVYGVIDVLELEHRLGFRPSITLEQMISEALQNVNFNSRNLDAKQASVGDHASQSVGLPIWRSSFKKIWSNVGDMNGN